eukprot:6209171-Pleurochrysis_carterae.AAC.1
MDAKQARVLRACAMRALVMPALACMDDACTGDASTWKVHIAPVAAMSFMMLTIRPRLMRALRAWGACWCNTCTTWMQSCANNRSMCAYHWALHLYCSIALGID